MPTQTNSRSEMTSAYRRAQKLARYRWLREMVFEEWTLKLVALVITLGLWFGVTVQRAPAAMRVRNVPLSFLLPEDMEISNEAREQVEVTLSGEKNKLDSLIARNLVITADVHGYREGERVVRLTPENVAMELPSGVRVVKVEPGTVPLRLERRIERQIEVVARLEGEPAEGFILRGAIATPSRITVRGPLSHVQRLGRVLTETISIGNRRESFSAGQVAVDVEDERVAALDGVVSVQIFIEKQAAEQQQQQPPTTPRPAARPAPRK